MTTTEGALRALQRGKPLEEPHNAALSPTARFYRTVEDEDYVIYWLMGVLKRLLRNVSVRGKYHRPVFERDPLWQKNGASMFLWEGSSSGAALIGGVKVWVKGTS